MCVIAKGLDCPICVHMQQHVSISLAPPHQSSTLVSCHFRGRSFPRCVFQRVFLTRRRATALSHVFFSDTVHEHHALFQFLKKSVLLGGTQWSERSRHWDGRILHMCNVGVSQAWPIFRN